MLQMGSYSRSKSTDELLLKKIRHYISVIIDKHAFPDKNDLSLDHFYDVAKKRMYYNLRMFLVSNKVFTRSEKDIEFPRNLWNHFKLSLKRKLPKFMGDHITVEYVFVPVIVHEYHMCPHVGAGEKKGDLIHVQFLKGEQRNEK